MKKYILFILFFLPIIAAGPLDNVQLAMRYLCEGMTGLLPVVAMLMTVLAAAIYAAGQMMGAETRARANVWATASLTGAMIGVLIATVVPPVLTTIGGSVSCGGCSHAGWIGCTPTYSPYYPCCAGLTCHTEGTYGRCNP